MVVANRVTDGTALPSYNGHPQTVYGLFPMDRGRMGSFDYTGSVAVWDVQSGKLRGGATHLAQANQQHDQVARSYISPDGRYVACGADGTCAAREKTIRSTGPFRMTDTVSGKPVLATEWLGGSVFFTTSPSRVLLAEHGGRFPVVQAPLGQPDGERALAGSRPGSPNRTLAMSADGGVILYSGRTPDQGQGTYALDGRTGR